MGFCRRCGDIVIGPRCKCGGAAVAPSVQFSREAVSDRWTRTYVSKDDSHSRQQATKLGLESVAAPRKFVKPNGAVLPQVQLNNRISAHIQSVSVKRPSSPLKNSTHTKDLTTADDILFSPDSSTLSKAYGSVLQPKETLTTFSCVMCKTNFPPDATIYPDPSDPFTTNNFLCKPCFVNNGGSKGDCVACEKPVLILKTDGGFVENGGKYWHKCCFRCDACFKYIGDSPLVDLMGRPSCETCFNNCLKRSSNSDSPSSRRSYVTPERSDAKHRAVGGQLDHILSKRSSFASEVLQQDTQDRHGSPFNYGNTNRTSQNSSPIIEELTERLLTMKGSPSLMRRSPHASNRSITDVDPGLIQFNGLGLRDGDGAFTSDIGSSPAESSRRRSITEMDNHRLLVHSPSSTSYIDTITEISRSMSSFESVHSLPDLMSDTSDTATQSSGITTPPFSSVSLAEDDGVLIESNHNTPTSKLRRAVESVTFGSPQTPCAKCTKPLRKGSDGGRFVTVPVEENTSRTFHIECFICAVCGNAFEEVRDGQAPFVRCSEGYCHVGCAVPERVVLRPSPKINTSTGFSPRPLNMEQLTATPTSLFPKFGSTSICPGCHISVSPMEKGVVPGPQGSKWHSSCLVCGGKGSRKRDNDGPGCGKRLDSGAKTDGEGGVWCRECLHKVSTPLLPTRQGAPSMDRITPMHTGSIFKRFPIPNKLVPQATGSTTIARQFTGLGSSSLTTQLTGGGLSPTRQLFNRTPSPTKQIGHRFPRPKSVIGVRNGFSIDESRNLGDYDT